MRNLSHTHPLIYRAEERSILHLLWPQLDALQTAIAAQDGEAALKLLAQLVPGGKTAWLLVDAHQQHPFFIGFGWSVTDWAMPAVIATLE